jgi:4-hydroxy-tetrahydrodipicolinate reductase
VSGAARRRVCVVGALGRMGECVRAALAESGDLALGAALESPGHPGLGASLEHGVAVAADPGKALASSDVVIDFSVPAASLALLRAAAEVRVPCVVGTTGFGEAERAELEALARRTPLVVAANFSVAVNVLVHLVERAARLLGPGYAAEIVELHHAAKRDAPSGTALRLARAAAEGSGLGAGARFVLERAGETGARPPGVIGIQALRGGDNPGEHTVLFLGTGERLELVHRASTRDHFARGAVAAARWVLGRPPGLYSMEHVLQLG